MRPVKDSSGRRYVLCGTQGPESLVWNPRTNEMCYLKTEEIRPLQPTELSENVTPPDLLLAFVHRRGPLDVRTLSSQTTFCESDLHGLLAELRTAGLLRETTIADERAYETTPAYQPAERLLE